MNQEPCPYEAIGCKFHHAQSKACRIYECQDLLCPLTHHDVMDDEEDSEVMEEETQEENMQLSENQCHLCRLQFLTKDDIYYHVQVNHQEYFYGMMEVAARMSNQNILIQIRSMVSHRPMVWPDWLMLFVKYD
jgi:hypothetical protein